MKNGIMKFQLHTQVRYSCYYPLVMYLMNWLKEYSTKQTIQHQHKNDDSWRHCQEMINSKYEAFTSIETHAESQNKPRFYNCQIQLLRK